jgi:hypothetical protein
LSNRPDLLHLIREPIRPQPAPVDPTWQPLLSLFAAPNFSPTRVPCFGSPPAGEIRGRAATSAPGQTLPPPASADAPIQSPRHVASCCCRTHALELSRHARAPLPAVLLRCRDKRLADKPCAARHRLPPAACSSRRHLDLPRAHVDPLTVRHLACAHCSVAASARAS